jgi:hypothetical protein
MLKSGFSKVKIKESLYRPNTSPEDSRRMSVPYLKEIGT